MKFREIERLIRKKGVDSKTDIIELVLKLSDSTDFRKYLDDFSIWMHFSATRSFTPRSLQPGGDDFKDLEKFLIQRDFESALKKGLSVDKRKDYYLKNIQLYFVSKEDINIIAGTVENAASWDEEVVIVPTKKRDTMVYRDDVVSDSRKSAIVDTGTLSPFTSTGDPQNVLFYGINPEAAKVLKSILTTKIQAGSGTRRDGIVTYIQTMKLEDAEKLLLQLKSKSSSTRNFFDSRFHLSTVPNSIIPALEKRITTLKASSPNSNPAKTTPPTFITDPTVHIEQDDRYIDKLASVLSNAYGIGNYLITWEKNNEKFLIGIPYRDIFDQKVTPCITEGRVLYTDKSSALKASEDKSKELGNAFRVITYYRHKTKFIDIILPTLFTLNSTPRIYKGIQNLLSDPTDYQQYLTDTGIILKLYKDAIVTVPTGASGVVATAGDIILSQDPDAKAGGSPPMPVKLPSGPIPKPVNKVVHLVQRLIRGTKDIFMESLGGKIRKVHRVGKYEIYETEAGQLMGTHKALTEFRKANPAYNGWDSHHIIEEEHLVSFFKNLVYDDLPCVLLPKVAHANRIRGSVAGKANQLMTEKEVIAMYKNAYEELLDDYTDNGQSSIVSELLSVMLSMMR